MRHLAQFVDVDRVGALGEHRDRIEWGQGQGACQIQPGIGIEEELARYDRIDAVVGGRAADKALGHVGRPVTARILDPEADRVGPGTNVGDVGRVDETLLGLHAAGQSDRGSTALAGVGIEEQLSAADGHDPQLARNHERHFNHIAPARGVVLKPD